MAAAPALDMEAPSDLNPEGASQVLERRRSVFDSWKMTGMICAIAAILAVACVATLEQSEAAKDQESAPRVLQTTNVLSEEMQQVLAKHNEYRCMHGVPLLTWDVEIAANAQEWADRGIVEHSPWSFRNVNGVQCGENLYWASWSTGESATIAWYSEIEHTDPYGVVTGHDPNTGHYTQVVWKDTTKLGCGLAWAEKFGRQGQFWLCQYGPLGNIGDQYVANVLPPTQSQGMCDGSDSNPQDIVAEVVEAAACAGNDCSSIAACPTGTSVMECASEPANDGDGIQVESTKCTSRGSNHRRRGNPIKAIAVCSSQSTSVAVSNAIFLDSQHVSASCSNGNALSCYCHSPWKSSVCGETVFGPSGDTCAKTIGSSSGRRRGVDKGAGAKVYALCEASTASESQLRTVWGDSCSENDCSSVAACPSGTSVIDCASLPANDGDGIQVESTKCTARGGNNRRRVRSIKAVAVCSQSQATSVVVSDSMYLDNQEVSASCSNGNPLKCYCHSSWTSSVCGGTTEFAPSGSMCKKTIGASSGRRRMTEKGAGVKIYALCRA